MLGLYPKFCISSSGQVDRVTDEAPSSSAFLPLWLCYPDLSVHLFAELDSGPHMAPPGVIVRNRTDKIDWVLINN